jgi:hypothetical protein
LQKLGIFPKWALQMRHLGQIAESRAQKCNFYISAELFPESQKWQYSFKKSIVFVPFYILKKEIIVFFPFYYHNESTNLANKKITLKKYNISAVG